LLTICLSGIFWLLINATQTVNAAYIFGLMWMPGVPAILTGRILGRPLHILGLGKWKGGFVLIGYLIPIAYCLVAADVYLRRRCGRRRGRVLGQERRPEPCG
jgi:hypothetical protein